MKAESATDAELAGAVTVPPRRSGARNLLNGNGVRAAGAARLLALSAGVVAFALVLAVTDPPGPGLDTDALAYLGAARSLVAAGSYRVPTAAWSDVDSTAVLAHFPPGYPTALAIPIRLGLDAPTSARLVQALAAFVTAATVALLLAESVGVGTAALAVAALAVTRAMLVVHLSVLSEPLFLAAMALVLAALVREPARPWRAAIPAAVAALTRYAGVAVVGGAVLWQLLLPLPWRTRVRRAVLVALPSVLALGAWVVRTRHLVGTHAIRTVSVYGGWGPTLHEGAATLADWLVPDPARYDEPMRQHGAIAVAAAGAMALVVGSAMRARPRPAPEGREDRAPGEAIRSPSRPSLARGAALLLVCYVLVVLLSRLVADPGIPLDDRLLAPVLLLGTLLLAVALHRWWGAHRSPLARAAAALALGAWGSASLAVVRNEAAAALEYGSDFAGTPWRTSAVLAWARENGRGAALYSDWPPPVYFHVGRPVRALPPSADPATLRAFADTLRVRRGRVLSFDLRNPGGVSREALRRVLRTDAALEDGVVLAP